MTGHLKQSYYFRIFTVEIDHLHVIYYKEELMNSAYSPSGINSRALKRTDAKLAPKCSHWMVFMQHVS